MYIREWKMQQLVGAHPFSFTAVILLALTINITFVHGFFKCEEDGFFPDKKDCWVYHICDGGTHSVRACEEDLFFNPKTGLCDWPMNVDCKEAVKPTTKPKVTTKPRSTTTEVATTRSQEEKDTDGICATDDYGYIAHPKDCRKYYYCQEGKAKVFTCVGGLLWNQATGDCVWPLDSDCPSVKKTTLPSKFNDQYTKQNNELQIAEMRKKIYGTIECPPDQTGFFPNPYDCSAYHFCNLGHDQVMLCEPGLFYRHDKQVCDWQVNSDCTPKCPKNMDKFRIIDPKSCCRYFECVNERLVVQLCQYPMLFDTQTKQCLDYSKVKCGTRKECTNPCQYFTNEDPSLCEMVPSCSGKPQGVYLDQNRANCQHFYSCRDDRVFNHTKCPNNMRFNQFEGRCMPSNFVACSSGSVVKNTSHYNFVYFLFVSFCLSFFII